MHLLPKQMSLSTSLETRQKRTGKETENHHLRFPAESCKNACGMRRPPSPRVYLLCLILEPMMDGLTKGRPPALADCSGDQEILVFSSPSLLPTQTRKTFGEKSGGRRERENLCLGFEWTGKLMDLVCMRLETWGLDSEITGFLLSSCRSISG